MRIRRAIGPALVFACAAGASGRVAAQGQRELNFVPAAGGDSDIGFGIGGAGNFAELAPGQPPYRWRLDGALFVTFKLRGGGLVLPFQDYNLQLTVPRVGPGGALRLQAFVAYTDEATARYYGIGNASPPLGAGEPIQSIEYARMHPTMSVEARAHVVRSLHVLFGGSYTYNRLDVPPDTRLAQQQALGPPDVRELLGNFDPHGVALLTCEVQWDARDDDSVTRSGQFHTLRFRGSPHLGGALPYEYERLTLTTRFYSTIIERRLRLLYRFVGDLLFDDPPFYELARFDETPAIGGAKAVRGVPAQRYYGKVKLFGNFEAVSEVWPFFARGKAFVLSVAAFFDAGRTWTELGQSHPELDGTGVGLKYGAGGGLRLQEGRTFIVRLDVAWSPDARPLGVYFAAGQIF